MTISATIVKDSVGPNGVRLTTFVLKFHRFVLSEFNTHRMFSRNASSSRAIPIEKQIKMIEEDCAMPLEFRKNQKGMQAGDALDEQNQQLAKLEWIKARDLAIQQAKELIKLGVHKQYVNRLLEPFSHISVIVSATEYSNFFALRHHSMAQPEIAELARQMWELYKNNVPIKLYPGEWHLPFVTDEEIKDYFSHGWLPLIKKSVARCARVSYLNHEGKESTFEQDCALYDRLLKENPKHSSPAEHQAQVWAWFGDPPADPKAISHFSGNFRGWNQYRQMIPGQNITKFEGPLG